MDRRGELALESMRRRILSGCRPGRTETSVPGLSLVRADAPASAVPSLYEPRLSLVLQGSKRCLLEGREFPYGEGTMLVTALPLPVLSAVVDASADRPFLALSLRIDVPILAEMSAHLPAKGRLGPSQAIAVAPLAPEILDAADRLLGLLERPHEIPALAPLLSREIHFRLLGGPAGPSLGTLLRRDAGPSVGDAVSWIRDHYDQALRVEDLARRCARSSSAFHRDFKAATSMSPLRYQKLVRLQEARRLFLSGRTDAASVGRSVGYASPSQFNREYHRLFGQPPRRDGMRLRSASPA